MLNYNKDIIFLFFTTYIKSILQKIISHLSIINTPREKNRFYFLNRDNKFKLISKLIYKEFILLQIRKKINNNKVLKTFNYIKKNISDNSLYFINNK